MTTVAQAGATTAPAAGPDPITEPGIYEMTNEEYHSHRYALSSSGARKLLPPSCPAIFRYEQDHPQPPKKVFDIGSAAHKAAGSKACPKEPRRNGDHAEADDKRTRPIRNGHGLCDEGP